MLIQILLEKSIPLSKLCDIIQIYPQVLINAKIDPNKRELYKTDETIQNKIKELENNFKNDGRVIIRPSGTEPLIRVMIEGENKEFITEQAEELAKLIEEKLK